MKIITSWKKMRKNWVTQILLPLCAILSMAFSAVIAIDRIIGEEQPRTLAAILDMGSFQATHLLVESPDALAQAKAVGFTEAAWYPRTLGQMERAGLLTIRRGSEIVDLFRVEGIANLYMWEQIRRKPIASGWSYVFLNDLTAFEALQRDLRIRLGENQVRVFSDGNLSFGGDVLNNYIMEVERDADELRRLVLGPDNEALAAFQNHLLEPHLVLGAEFLAPEESRDELRRLIRNGQALGSLEVRDVETAEALLADPEIQGFLAAGQTAVSLPSGLSESIPAGQLRLRPLSFPLYREDPYLFDRLYAGRANALVMHPLLPNSSQWFEEMSYAEAIFRTLRRQGYLFGPLNEDVLPRWRGILQILFLLFVLGIPALFFVMVFELSEGEALALYLSEVMAAMALLVAGDRSVLFEGLAVLLLTIGPLWGLMRWGRTELLEGGDIRQDLAEAVAVLSATIVCAVALIGLTDASLLAPGAFPVENPLFYLLPGLFLFLDRFRFSAGLYTRRVRLWHVMVAVGIVVLIQAGIIRDLGEILHPLIRHIRFIGRATGITPRSLLILFGNTALIVAMNRVRVAPEENHDRWFFAAFLGQAAVIDALADPGRSLVGNMLEGLLLTMVPYLSVFVYASIQERRGLLPEIDLEGPSAPDSNKKSGDPLKGSNQKT